MLPSGVRAALLALILLGVATGAAPVHAGGAPTQSATTVAAAAASQSGAPIQTAGPLARAEPNNSSAVQHENPDHVDEAGDDAALQRWFAQRLSDRLAESAVTLDQGEYEQAQSVLGEEYADLYAKYVDVAGDTGEADNDTVADEFKAAQERQQAYASTLQQYQETRQQYIEAKQNGNETRARKLARELERYADRLNETEANLTANYKTISNATETNTTAVQTTINTTVTNVSTQQAAIRNETFTETTLTVRQASPTASFDDPLRMSGQLTAANGTTLANRTILVEFGPQAVKTQTTANGTFTAMVRPTVSALGNQSITVRYVPQNTSVYLGTEDTVATNVTQVTPTVTLSAVAQTVRFNETVTVAGTVYAGNVSAAGVPVRLTVGTTVLATTRTAANGTFALNATVPAGIPAGEAALRVSLPVENRALAAVNTTATLTIAHSQTRLTATRTSLSEDFVRVTGALTTADGRQVPNQTLAVRVGGATVATTTTNASGRYAVTLNTSSLSTGEGAGVRNATVVYTATGNLAGARAVITLQPAGSGWAWLPVSPWVLVGGLLGLGGVGGLATRRWDLFGRAPATDPAPPGDTTQASPADERTADAATTPGPATLLAHAASLRTDGDTDAAVLTAYEAARHWATARLALAPARAATQTHWEFYRTCRQADALDAPQVDALEQLTEAYERARFTPDGAATETVTAAIEAAAGLIEASESDT